jgi:hypothetical protein
MQSMVADRFSVGASVVGMALMIAALATGANPAEGSVITPWLRETIVGNVVLFVLIVTACPTMLAADWTLGALWKLGLSMPVSLHHPLYSVVLQGLIYFCLAKLVLSCICMIRRS